jgi:hypothetical protein
MIIPAMGDELFLADRGAKGQTDRQTDITKLMVAFRSFEKQIDRVFRKYHSSM